jgi:methionyl-tRNA formyltransferase
MNIIFMGSGKFAVPVLDKLMSSPYRIMGVITQPDRPAGRGQELMPTPVKEAAIAKGLHIFEPADVNSYEFIRELNALSPDIIVVCAYGQILKRDILTLPRYYCINVHPSLLPKYRGAAPVMRTLLNGETHTGVAIIKVIEALDAGPILGMRRYAIPEGAGTAEVEEILAAQGGELCVEVIQKIEQGTVLEVPQNDRDATYAKKFDKEEAQIDWRKTSKYLSNFVRAMQPNPGAYTFWSGERIKIHKAKPLPLENPPKGVNPGTIVFVRKDGIYVTCADGVLVVQELQPAGRNKMTAAEFKNGANIKVGDAFN